MNLKRDESKLETRKAKVTLILQTSIIVVALLPFIMSAFVVLLGIGGWLSKAKELAGFGFVYLIIAIVFFVVSFRFKEKT
jgi:hypothetical protein